MFRIIEIVLIVLVLVATVQTFRIKSMSENSSDEIRKLQAQIRDHEGAIDLLEADWSLLNQPNRVQNLVEAFRQQLQLDVTEAEQIVAPSELPRIKPEPDPAVDVIADLIATGSVE